MISVARSSTDISSRHHELTIGLRQLHEEVEETDETNGRGEGTDGDVHLGLALESEAALTARGAALVLLPRSKGSVVDVAASLAHPELSVDLGIRGVGLLTLQEGAVSDRDETT